MRRKPRPSDEPFLTKHHWLEIAAFGALIAAAVFAVFYLALDAFSLDRGMAVTVAFLALAGGQLAHVFNMRSLGEPAADNQITRNRYVWGAIGICLVLLAAAVWVPPVAAVLGLKPPSAIAFALATGGAAVPMLAGPLLLRMVRK